MLRVALAVLLSWSGAGEGDRPKPRDLDAPLLPDFSEPVEPVQPVRVGPPPPTGKHMFRAGVAVTIIGALGVASGSTLVAHMIPPNRVTGHVSYGLVGLIPLVAGGGLTTLGALLMHEGQARAWARTEWEAGRAPGDPESSPMTGAGLLLAGPLTIAPSAVAFTWGLYELAYECSPNTYCPVEPDPGSAALFLATGGAGMIFGVTLTVLGARQRARYMRWRVGEGRSVHLRPTGWASPRGVGVGLVGGF
jgi:hypothetical protein